MAMRWCAAGLVEAKKQFRRVNGHMHLRALRTVLDEHARVAVTPSAYTAEQEVAA
jgi:putative transposase